MERRAGVKCNIALRVTLRSCDAYSRWLRTMSESPAELIRVKRQGRTLDGEQLLTIAQGIGSGGWSEGQIGAFAMAVALRGLDATECRDFTFALRDSGVQLGWSDLPGPALDKHSTGGVGDCVSLALAPLVAACGGYVPMISGRGLGHTGGTLDKLESVAGYNVNPSREVFHRVVRDVGCAIVGQSADLVPADGILYAVRDVTATVDVPELIAASILSKKLAGGAQCLVLDVKTGSGAQTPSRAKAVALARRMQAVARGTALTLAVMISDMDQVLGTVAGNALELRAVISWLTGGEVSPRLRDLTFEQAARLLCLGGMAVDSDAARVQLVRAVESGAAGERLGRMLAALGGATDVVEHPGRYLSDAPLRVPATAVRSGYVAAIDVRAIGEAVVDLGGGRRSPRDRIQHDVGLTEVCERGAEVNRGDALAIVHARTRDAADAAVRRIRAAYTIADVAPAEVPIWQWLDDCVEGGQ